ncbi:MAG TPA: hypothetical protein VHX38_19500 [Pseudonocardiaceae bacterium]|nr:hypothetical protein [Pseudonocardiaceae bacterium]
MTEQSSQTTAAPRKAGLFDLRWIIALLFGIYGIVVTVMGIGFTSQAELNNAGGINVNLWTGIPMLVVAILFAVWAQLRPVRIPIGTSDDSHDDDDSAPADPFAGGESS